ncbi:MAG TPA: T9SS type A sorting domain-containing protein, partial [Prolixibacteraceae bacterium]
AKFDPLFGAIYMWEELDGNNGVYGKYTVTNNFTGPNTYIQQGQAFMVNMAAGAAPFSFNSDMQIHNPSLTLKQANNPWPTINLQAAVNKQNSTTIIAFNSAMTKGLDPTYDAGLLKGTTDLVVYSKLVEGNAVPLAIQALPENNNSEVIIPIGIDFKTGGQVVFSAELLNLQTGSKVILEDKIAKTFTDLSKGSYTVAIPSNSSISDRFQLHTTDLVSGLGNEPLVSKELNAFAIKNIEIRIVGDVTSDAVATLYDVQGRVVLIENLKEGSLNVIPTSSVVMGVYMLSVKDNAKVQTFKLLIRE